MYGNTEKIHVFLYNKIPLKIQRNEQTKYNEYL